MSNEAPISTVDVAGGIWYVDVNYLGRSRLIATGVMETPAGLLLVDPGPSRSVDNLLAAINERGFTLSDVAAILLTHIHLDHAGATGTLAQRNRRIRVFVHTRGARHMVNPSRLLGSARRIYGDRMEELWGAFESVPEDQIEALSGGELIAPGGRDLDVRYTPGHAIHHVTYFDRSTRTAFVGDTGGMRLQNVNHIVPLTPPPDIDVESWLTSLEKIEDLDPERLFLTHFGVSDDVATHLEDYRRELKEWSDVVRGRLAHVTDPYSAAKEFGREVLEDWQQKLTPDDFVRYRDFADPAGSFLGLARYWERRRGRNG